MRHEFRFLLAVLPDVTQRTIIRQSLVLVVWLGVMAYYLHMNQIRFEGPAGLTMLLVFALLVVLSIVRIIVTRRQVMQIRIVIDETMLSMQYGRRKVNLPLSELTRIGLYDDGSLALFARALPKRPFLHLSKHLENREQFLELLKQHAPLETMGASTARVRRLWMSVLFTGLLLVVFLEKDVIITGFAAAIALILLGYSLYIRLRVDRYYQEPLQLVLLALLVLLIIWKFVMVWFPGEPAAPVPTPGEVAVVNYIPISCVHSSRKVQ